MEYGVVTCVQIKNVGLPESHGPFVGLHVVIQANKHDFLHHFPCFRPEWIAHVSDSWPSWPRLVAKWLSNSSQECSVAK